MAKNKLYLYLARRDKKGMEIVAAFPFSKKAFPTRIEDLSKMNLAPEVVAKVLPKVTAKRMTHELYAESAGSYQELRESLRLRGYTSLPTHQFTGHTGFTKVNESSLITKESTMVQRSSRS